MISVAPPQKQFSILNPAGCPVFKQQSRKDLKVLPSLWTAKNADDPLARRGCFATFWGVVGVTKPAPSSRGCPLNPKGWWIDTLLTQPFGTPFKVLVGIYIYFFFLDEVDWEFGGWCTEVMFFPGNIQIDVREIQVGCLGWSTVAGANSRRFARKSWCLQLLRRPQGYHDFNEFREKAGLMVGYMEVAVRPPAATWFGMFKIV